MKSITFLLASVVLAIVVSPVSAQSTRALTAAARRIDDFNKQSDQAARDEMNREMRGKKPSAEEIRKAKAIEAQIEQDLEALQTEYNNIVLKLQSREAIADTFVADSSGRIHKHSDRLKENIKFPESKEGEPVQNEIKQANKRKALIELCTQILSFFKSPMFESPNVLDVKNAEESRKTLKTIIRLSGELKERSN